MKAVCLAIIFFSACSPELRRPVTPLPKLSVVRVDDESSLRIAVAVYWIAHHHPSVDGPIYLDDVVCEAPEIKRLNQYGLQILKKSEYTVGSSGSLLNIGSIEIRGDAAVIPISSQSRLSSGLYKYVLQRDQFGLWRVTRSQFIGGS
jgi:hypothetical protein